MTPTGSPARVKPINNGIEEHEQNGVIVPSNAPMILALNRLEREDAPDNTTFYYLDLIKHRDISNSIADKFNVYHESPQILIIKNGECVYDESHQGINMSEIAEQVVA